jgi:predicted acetyltransferase
LPDTPNFRFARPDEIPAIARLIAHSFPGPGRQPPWWEQQLAQPRYGGGAETLWVGEERGRIIAACQMHPLRQWMAGELFACTGVGGVAISPTHRKRGLGAALVASGLRATRERGDIVSALYPFRVAFYQRLGYGEGGVAHQYQVPPNTLPDSAERHRVELLEDDASRGDALALYGRWARTQNGQLERDVAIWSHLFTPPDRALVGYRAISGDLEGYAIVNYRVDLPVRDRYLEVDELLWTSPDARRGLYGWLASLGDQWYQLLLRGLPSHRLGDWIAEPRLPHHVAPSWQLWAPAATLLAGPMFRLLDVHAFERRGVRNADTLRAGIELRDAQFDSNDGAWLLHFEDGTTTVSRDGAADLTLRMDVSTLSRMFIGALTATQARDAGLLTCERGAAYLAALDELLTLPESWMFDRF